MPKWPENSLSWYEAGYSMPHPSNVEMIAEATGTSVCWIMFGLGPIRSGGRDLQAVRHQNRVYLYREAGKAGIKSEVAFLSGLRLAAEKIGAYIDKPFQHIAERLARRIEKAGGKPSKWLDEQHVESDGLCSSFPDELRDLMTIYSELDQKNKGLILAMARTIAKA